jgi:hypothetical protein
LSVTRLETTPATQNSRGGYTLFEFKPELIEHTVALMARDLTDLRTKPVGSAAVTANQPKTSYVVRRGHAQGLVRPAAVRGHDLSRGRPNRGLGGDPLYASAARPHIALQQSMHLERLRHAQAKLELDEEKLKSRDKDGPQE